MPSSLATQNKVQVGPRRAPKARAMGLQVIATRCIWVTAFSRIEMSGSYRFPEFSRHAVRICQMQSAKSNLTEGPAPFSLLSGSWNMTPRRWFSGADRWLARTHQDVLGCAAQSILDTERMSCLNCRFMGLRCRKNNRLCRRLIESKCCDIASNPTNSKVSWACLQNDMKYNHIDGIFFGLFI